MPTICHSFSFFLFSLFLSIFFFFVVKTSLFCLQFVEDLKLYFFLIVCFKNHHHHYHHHYHHLLIVVSVITNPWDPVLLFLHFKKHLFLVVIFFLFFLNLFIFLILQYFYSCFYIFLPRWVKAVLNLPKKLKKKKKNKKNPWSYCWQFALFVVCLCHFLGNSFAF